MESGSSTRSACPRGCSRSTSASSSATGTTCRAPGPTPGLQLPLLPWRALADLRTLAALARGHDLVVNDSLHPGAAPRSGARVPHPGGAALRREPLAGDGGQPRRPRPALGRRALPARARAVRDRAFARIVHTLGSTEPEAGSPPRTHRLAPIVARPGRTRAEVRAELGVPAGVPLAAVYLNPHFKDPPSPPRSRGAPPARLPPPRRRRGVPGAARLGGNRRSLRRRGARRRALRLRRRDGRARAGAELGHAAPGAPR